ncbi:hypothetical protein NDU88_000969 [Pleurodeles waltl]|uniref:Uncharacterized protein n=1 Tax=Pleurodeles waltl TaxID=8319 RepID=A0AAV7RA94_PLEWA|nr:hypothetical protein NDU88_000969 [Pleurodeles waltl]
MLRCALHIEAQLMRSLTIYSFKTKRGRRYARRVPNNQHYGARQKCRSASRLKRSSIWILWYADAKRIITRAPVKQL